VTASRKKEAPASNSLLNMQKGSRKAGRDVKPGLHSPTQGRWVRERSASRRSWDSRQDGLNAASRKDARLSTGQVPSLSSGLDQSTAVNGHLSTSFHSPTAVPSLPDTSFQYWSDRVAEVEGQLIPLFRSGVSLPTLKAATQEAFDQLYAFDWGSEVAQLRQEALSWKEAKADLASLNEDLLGELQDCTQANQELIQLLSRVQVEKSSLQSRLLQAKRTYHQLKSRAIAGKLEDLKLSEETEVACQTLESLPDEDLRRLQAHLNPRETLETGQNALKLALKQAQEQLIPLQSQVKSLVSDLESRQNSSSVRELAVLRLKNETNLSLIGSLKLQIESLKQAGYCSPETVATEPKATLQDEIKQLHSQVTEKAADNSVGSDLETVLYHIKRENVALKQDNADLMREKGDLMETLARLKAEQTSKLAQISVKKDKKRKPTEKLLKQIADLELKLVEMSEERATLLGKMSDLQNQAELIEEISHLRLENEELAEVVKSIQANSVRNGNITSIEEAKQQLLQVQHELKSLQASKSNNLDLEKRIKDLEIDNEALKASCEDAEQFLATSEKRYSLQIEGLRMEINTKSALYRDQTIANTRKILALKQEIAKLQV